MNEHDFEQTPAPVVENPAAEPITAAAQPAPSAAAEPDMGAPQCVSAPAPCKTAAPQPRWAGRITLGIALIVTGVLVTCGLLMPNLDLFMLAKFAPLILVALGIEILIASCRRDNRQVKIGFGTTLLCLVLISGSIGFSLLPQVWNIYGPGYWEKEAAVRAEIEQAIYSKMDATHFDSLAVSVLPSASKEAPSIVVNAQLRGTYASAEEFAQAAAPVLQLLAENHVDYTHLENSDPAGSWTLTVSSGVYSLTNVTAQQLTEMVERSHLIVDDSLAFGSISDDEYQQMQQNNLLATPEALKASYDEGLQEGYTSGFDEGYEQGSAQG